MLCVISCAEGSNVPCLRPLTVGIWNKFDVLPAAQEILLCAVNPERLTSNSALEEGIVSHKVVTFHSQLTTQVSTYYVRLSVGTNSRQDIGAAIPLTFNYHEPWTLYLKWRCVWHYNFDGRGHNNEFMRARWSSIAYKISWQDSFRYFTTVCPHTAASIAWCQ